jgi:hypothetical protein
VELLGLNWVLEEVEGAICTSIGFFINLHLWRDLEN